MKVLDHEFTFLFHKHEDKGDVDPDDIIPMHKNTSSLVNLSHRCPHCNDRVLEVKALGEPVTRNVSKNVRQHFVAVGCAECGKHLGTACRQQTSIFGWDEDRAILEGRPRVYGLEKSY